MSFKTVSVIGLGYIGLPTAAVFASRKINVVGVDVNQSAVDTINRGEIHIVEPELDIVVHAAVTEGYLKAVTAPEQADAFMIAVPTPFKGNNHEPDLAYIEAASKAIAPVLKKGDLVVLESTSPVGATEQMAAWLAEARSDLTFPQTHGEESDIRVAHCPERVLPGHVIRELVENDRVIGGMTAKCSQAAVNLYKIFVEGDCVITNARTAEMAKLTENSFRDVNIAFANELSLLCDEKDINVRELIALANRHPRVNILQPGVGVGGHCIAVDPWFLVNMSPEKAQIIHKARQVNLGKTEWVIQRIKNTAQDHKQATICLYGLAFKPDIDDLRESPAVDVAKAIYDYGEEMGIEVKFIEPNVESEEASGLPITALEKAKSLNALHVLLVNHKEFSDIAFSGVTLNFVS